MRLLISGAMALALVACSSSAPPQGKGRAPAKSDVATQVAAVRAAGVNGNELEVQPLRDPQVEDLRVQAEAQEARREIKQASATLDRALALTPGDPDLLQWKAELALLGRNWPAAEALANDSFQKGPKLGGLCRRNWTTIAYARQGRGDAAGAAAARGQVASCTVAPPVRM
jgi:predicted Zn-dependent protease